MVPIIREARVVGSLFLLVLVPVREKLRVVLGTGAVVVLTAMGRFVLVVFRVASLVVLRVALLVVFLDVMLVVVGVVVVVVVDVVVVEVDVVVVVDVVIRDVRLVVGGAFVVTTSAELSSICGIPSSYLDPRRYDSQYFEISPCLLPPTFLLLLLFLPPMNGIHSGEVAPATAKSDGMAVRARGRTIFSLTSMSTCLSARIRIR